VKPALRILAVPNDDGFGPSALLSYVVKTLLALRPGSRATIWNRSRADYNRSLYRDFIAAGRVNVEPVGNLLELAKDASTGEVSIAGTLSLIGDYRAASDRYATGAQAGDFDLVVEFGVPAAARWAARLGIPCVGIFDHAWARTLEMILEDAPSVTSRQRAQWRKLVAAVRRDEAFTRKLFLFPGFISPPLFRAHWRDVAPRAAVRHFSGVLGGRTAWSGRQAREYLGFTTPGRMIMIQGGDTPAWDALLQRLVPALLNARAELDARRLNVAFYIPRRIAGRGDIARLADPAMARRHPRVRAFAPVPGGTTQELFPFVDLLVTRAGGGTVNDAVACRTPFVCVPERGHAQVEAILAACLRRGLTRVVDRAALEADPVRVILAEFDRTRDNRRMAAAMRQIPNRAEEKLARVILRYAAG
jgi:UDP:flavonoid glycosyltransferase YjiC (YdhE family)